MRRIRVLQVSNALGLGGTEKTVQTFCKYLDRSRFDVFACGRLAGGVRAQEIEKLDVQVIVGPADLNDVVRKLNIDICHIHRGGDYEPGSLPDKWDGRLRIVETNVFNTFDSRESEAIDAHLFVSEFSRRRYLRRYGQRSGARYEVLYNPVDFDEFPRQQKSFRYTVGQCARVDEQKWHRVVIDALPKVFRKVTQSCAVFQGLPETLRARLSSLKLDGRVQLLEPSLRMAEFYQRLDVFTHAARVGETFGCVIAEAMANGIPVVTLRTAQQKKSNAQAELVEHNITGFVCWFRWQYAGAVIELLRNHELRERFAKRGYEKAREEFEATKLTRKLEQLYLDVMDSHSAA